MRSWMAYLRRDGPIWPILLLVLVVLVPTACVLWLMQQATRNEQLAVRQRLAEAYQSQLGAIDERFRGQWQDNLKAVGERIADLPAEQAFAECVRRGLADSLIVLDPGGRILYPSVPQVRPATHVSAAWQRAERLEFVMGDPLAAATAYHELVRAEDPDQAARALQAEARCRARAGQLDQAIEILAATLQQGEFATAVDESGRWIAADADLRILQLSPRTSERFVATTQRLQQRLSRYGDGLLPAAQRWFLMQEARSLVGNSLQLPTWDAEHMAARWRQLDADFPTGAAVRPLAEDLWQAAVPDQPGIVLFRTSTLTGALHEAAAAHSVPSGMKVEPLGPGDALAGGELLSRSLAPQLPGWRLALTPTGLGTWDSAATRRKRYYLGTAVLMIVTTSALALMIGRAFKRQMRVSRLKNDLVATVSHELKTPLASIRLLVDTLLDGTASDPFRQREYLALIAKENARLTRLIDNFLTFSRLERGKPVIQCQVFHPAAVVQAVAEGCRDRFSGPGIQFRYQIAPDLPCIWGDPDALATILLNLLDNAYKYTGTSKRVELRAEVCGAEVQIQVRDNGIGLSPRAARRVFERFFRVDDHLARGAEGCGLGLSIVRYLVEAHGGRVWVDSQAGRGSTFVVRLPARSPAASCSAESSS